jgi:hypothetical protein
MTCNTGRAEGTDIDGDWIIGSQGGGGMVGECSGFMCWMMGGIC